MLTRRLPGEARTASRLPGQGRGEGGRGRRKAFLGALALCLGVVGWMISPYLLALLLGGLLALMALPLHQRLARSLGSTSAAALSTLLLSVLVIGPAGAFAFAAGRQAVALERELSGRKMSSPGQFARVLNRFPIVRAVSSPEEVAEHVDRAVRAAGVYASGKILKLAAGLPLFLLQAAMALAAFFFFLCDGRRFVDFCLSRGFLDRDVQEKLAHTFTETAMSTVLAGFAASAVQAALICAAYAALGVPGALVAGGATFLLAWLPLLGTLPASLAGVLYLYSEGEMVRMGVMIAIGLAAGAADNLVRVLVLNGRADMHPLIGLVAVIAGIDMFGILGLFIGPLLVAIALSMLAIWPHVAKREAV